MTPDRYNQIMHAMSNRDVRLDDDELAEGWHFCPERDDALSGPGGCSCLLDDEARETHQRVIEEWKVGHFSGDDRRLMRDSTKHFYRKDR